MNPNIDYVSLEAPLIFLSGIEADGVLAKAVPVNGQGDHSSYPWIAIIPKDQIRIHNATCRASTYVCKALTKKNTG